MHLGLAKAEGPGWEDCGCGDDPGLWAGAGAGTRRKAEAFFLDSSGITGWIQRTQVPFLSEGRYLGEEEEKEEGQVGLGRRGADTRGEGAASEPPPAGVGEAGATLAILTKSPRGSWEVEVLGGRGGECAHPRTLPSLSHPLCMCTRVEDPPPSRTRSTWKPGKRGAQRAGRGRNVWVSGG